MSAKRSVFASNPHPAEEVLGPVSVLFQAEGARELAEVARGLVGNLTATIRGTEAELAQHRDLVKVLQQKVGRLIFNGYPTGVDVCPSMHHGAPHPAATDVRSTSVGSGASWTASGIGTLADEGFPRSPERGSCHP